MHKNVGPLVPKMCTNLYRVRVIWLLIVVCNLNFFGCFQLYEGAPQTDDQKLLSTLCGDVSRTYTGTPGKVLTVVFKSNSDVEFPFNVVKFSIEPVASTD